MSENCGKSIFGEREELKVKEFVTPLKELLWNGRVLDVCAILLNFIKEHPNKETEIRNLYSYYYTRQSKMRYDEFRKQGYFIGSGVVESANKYLVQQRLKQAGMKWLIKGAHNILKLRKKSTKVMGNRLEQQALKLFLRMAGRPPVDCYRR